MAPPINLRRPGRVISMSKSDYLHDHPDHHVVFNANLAVKSVGKIWHGDLDITLDENDLKKLATELNEPIYIFRELDWRFDHISDWSKAVKVISL